MWQCSFAGFFDIFGITKCGKVILLQSVTDFIKVLQVLQSVTVTTKWDVTQYIDAIIALFKSFGHLKRLQSYLNSCYVNVSFTRDIKENNKILLFDANVIRRQGNWKPPSGGAYTHFDSFFVLYIMNYTLCIFGYALTDQCFIHNWHFWSKYFRKMVIQKTSLINVLSCF